MRRLAYIRLYIVKASFVRIARDEQGELAVIYCVVPRELAGKVHESLRAHFQTRPDVEVVVERRAVDRRASSARRARGATSPPDERRRIRGNDGRRMAERRAIGVPRFPLGLPRRLERFADQLAFVELARPSDRQQEDNDTHRLIARFQAGERETFVDIYVRYFDRVFGFLRLTLRDGHTAEDVAQEVFTRAFEHLPRFEIDAARPFRHWLFRIARNAAIDELGRGKRSQTCDPGDIQRWRDELSEPERGDALQPSLGWVSDPELLLFVERLPAEQSQVLALTYLLGFSTREIAKVLGTTPAAIFQKRSRALRTLESRLAAIGRRGERVGKPAPSFSLFRQAPVIRARRYALLW